jgi:hypothetical protein
MASILRSTASRKAAEAAEVDVEVEVEVEAA